MILEEQSVERMQWSVEHDLSDEASSLWTGKLVCFGSDLKRNYN